MYEGHLSGGACLWAARLRMDPSALPLAGLSLFPGMGSTMAAPIC